MDLRFASPSLYELDTLDTEVLACPVWQDVRPVEGVAGLCDWRLGGRLSRLMRNGLLLGELGEVMLIPGRPRLTFEKLLLFGAGPRGRFDEQVFAQVVRSMLDTVDALRAEQAVVELPGRHANLIAPERAADMLLETAGRSHEPSLWILVDDAEARRQVTQHMIEERRRVRRAP